MEPDYRLPAEETDEKEKRPGFLNAVVDILETLLLSVILFLIINAVSARIKIDGSSMEPTLQHGEFIIVSKLNYRFGEPQRGDIVVFDYPRNITQEYIKRVIGLPGDHVQIEDQKVYVNGQEVSEPYLNAPPVYEGEWDVPDEALFVLG
ncbi:MAG: signal peptidase I, partial [Anaerolineales bacterium]|nr:signal peptidase I [Anaerolineales bacterium]